MAWHHLGIVEGFVKWCLKAGYAVSTVNNRLSAIKVYAKLAAKAGVIPADELQLIRVVSGYGKQEGKRVDERRSVTRVGHKKAAPVRLTPPQARPLKTQPDSPQGRRDAMLMCLLLDHGLRVGEVVRLEVADFDLDRGELRFYRPKVDIEQTHQLTGDTWRIANPYFRLDAPKSGRVLLGSRKNGCLTKKPLSIRAIKKRVAFLGRTQLEIENEDDAELSPHDCRHYWATDAARNGTDVRNYRCQYHNLHNCLAINLDKIANIMLRNALLLWLIMQSFYLFIRPMCACMCMCPSKGATAVHAYR